METDNLKSLWISIQNKELKDYTSNEINIGEIIHKEHCNVLANVVYDLKKELIMNSVIIIIWIGLLLYAYVYLNLHFSFITHMLFGIIFLFLLFSFIMGIYKYSLIRRDNNTSTIRESFLSFRKRLLRANNLYFIVLTSYLYLLTARIIFGVIHEFKGIRQSGMFFPTLFIILVMAGVPWLLKLIIKQRFRKLFRNLDQSMHALENDVC